MTVRGFTWTEQHRHECEVRHVAGMATKQQRGAYLDGLERWRSPEAIAKLRADVAAAWRAAREPASAPPPLGESQAAGAQSSVHLGVNAARTDVVPVNGSFLDPATAGSSDPDSRVDSGAPA